MKSLLSLTLFSLLLGSQVIAQTKPVSRAEFNTKITSLSNTAALALSTANSGTLAAANALSAAQARLLTTTFASWTQTQASVDQGQNTDISGRQPLLTGTSSLSIANVSLTGPSTLTAPALVVRNNASSQNIYSFRDQNDVERMSQSQQGNMLVNGNFRILNGSDGAHFRIQNPYTPTSTTDANGLAGNIEWNDNGLAVKTSTGWKTTFLYALGSTAPDVSINNTITTATITTGGSYTFAAGVNRINVNPTTTISSLTLTLPPTTVDGRTIKVNFGGAMTSGTIVTSLSINQTGGGVPIQSNTPTTGMYGQVFIYTYDQNVNSLRREM